MVNGDASVRATTAALTASSSHALAVVDRACTREYAASTAGRIASRNHGSTKNTVVYCRNYLEGAMTRHRVATSLAAVMVILAGLPLSAQRVTRRVFVNVTASGGAPDMTATDFEVIEN